MRVRGLAFNRLIAAFLQGKPGCTFVDIYAKFIGPNGEPMPQYFSDDMHLNDAGYQIWADAVRPSLH